jgi:hypothetical protein
MVKVNRGGMPGDGSGGPRPAPINSAGSGGYDRHEGQYAQRGAIEGLPSSRSGHMSQDVMERGGQIPMRGGGGGEWGTLDHVFGGVRKFRWSGETEFVICGGI